MKRGDAVPMLLGTKKLCFYFIITVHGMCWVPPCPQGRHIPSLLVISNGAFMVEGEPERGPYKNKTKLLCVPPTGTRRNPNNLSKVNGG